MMECVAPHQAAIKPRLSFRARRGDLPMERTEIILIGGSLSHCGRVSFVIEAVVLARSCARGAECRRVHVPKQIPLNLLEQDRPRTSYDGFSNRSLLLSLQPATELSPPKKSSLT